ncbi:hypothetical protein BH10ACT11_BH10ACT11_19810 [soil metagenome]
MPLQLAGALSLAVLILTATLAISGAAEPRDGGRHRGGEVKRDTATVESITDGDTINATVHGKTEPIRFIGIDTPETYPVKECGGGKASKAMARALHPGDRIKLISDPSQDNRDRYDRILRFVEKRGSDIGRRQIRSGWADVYVYNHNPFRRVKEYRAAKAQARHHHRGVFANCHGHFHRAD